MAEFLLISDLDDTILGDDAALERFARFHDENGDWLRLVYASGRRFDSVRREVEATPLPPPEVVIGGVGSEVQHFPGGEILAGWRDRYGRDWDAARARELLSDEADLTPQPDEVQNAFKLSYYLLDATTERLDALSAKLERAGILADVIYSSAKDLDFLPRGVNKGSAALFVAESLGFAPEKVIVSGNSGNDVALFQHDFLGVIVSNAHEELKAWARRPRVYLAGSTLADGVCEGIEYWRSRPAIPRIDSAVASVADAAAESSSSGRRAERLDEGYRRCIDLLESCRSPHGYLASTTNLANYRRIWGRDSMIVGLAALLTGTDSLIDCCRRSIETLAAHQGPHGEIPSNVDPETNRVSYGGTAGRLDANLWFLIACEAYARVTGDAAFVRRILPVVQRVQFVLGAWEYNARGLLYVPPTGDWADEYVHSGYVLYDQLLYLQALRAVDAMQRRVNAAPDRTLVEKIDRLYRLIRANYWFNHEEPLNEIDIYHEHLYVKGRAAAPSREGCFWMPFFSPLGYGYRFDGMANTLASLFGVADTRQNEEVDRCVERRIASAELPLIPAFHPAILPKDEDWDDLQMTFSHTFKNAPYEYHNGGLWTLITGFYAASLAQRGENEAALRYLDAAHRANRMPREGREWSFSEYIHGRDLTPGGTYPMAWNAAAAIMAHHYLRGERLFVTE